MKKVLLFAGLAAAALSFVGCNKEADVKGLDGRKVEIILSDAQTRTVNDGMSTKWADGDALSVFYAPAGQTEYAVAQFDVSDPANNVASGTVELTAESYDWYLFYPYDSHLKTPANTGSGYMTVGGMNQTQKGNDSKEHLAGTNLPIVGVAKNVAVSTNPEVAMKHVSSVVAIKVTNDTDKPLIVNTISFTAPEDIVGTYYIDFSGETVKFKSSGANYVSNSVTLSVEDGTAIAAGASAKFYLAVKPFTTKADDVLKVSVVADQGEVEKTVTLSQVYTFAGGSIKTLNVSYEAPEVIPTITVADIKEAITSTSQNTPSEFTGQLSGATVSYVNGNSAFIQDEGAGILLYMSGHGLKAGDVLSGIISGKGWIRYGVKQLTSLTGFEKTEGTAPEAINLTVEDLLADYDRYVSVRVNLAGAEVTDAITKSDRNGVLKQGDAQLNLYAQVTNTLEVPAGVYDKMIGYPTYYNETKQLGLWAQDDVALGNQPFFSAEAVQSEVPATATSATINVHGNVDWTVSVPDGVTASPVSGSGEGTVTLTFAENNTQEEKEYIVYIRTDNTKVENDELDITITQAAADAAGEHTVTIDFSMQGFENAAEVTSVSEYGVTASFDKGTNSNAPKYYTSGTAVRLYGSNSMTVSAGGKTIVSIELTFGSGDGSNEITTDVSTYEEPVWTGNAGSVVFTIGGTTGQRRIKAITVKYKDESSSTVTLESIAVSGQTTTFTVGDTFSFNGKVTATYSDGTTKEVTPTEVSSPDLSSAGEKEVTVTYTEGDVTKTFKYNITVNAAPEHDGSLAKPYTVAEAMAETTALGEGKTSSDSYYTKGVISQIDEVSAEHGNATYFISDDGTTGTQFKVYRGRFVGNAPFSAEDQIKVGDEVLVYGKFTYYKPKEGASELEIASGNYIHSLTRGGTAIHALSATISETSVGSAATTLTVSVSGDVAWTASATNGATVSPASGNGVGNVTVSIPANTAAEAKTYKVSVTTTAAVDNKTFEFTVDQAALDNTSEWVATSLGDIKSTDVFVIVSTNASGESYAMTNNNAASSAPTAKAVTVSNDKLSGTPEGILQWSLGGSEGAYIFYVAGDTSNWLYVTNANNGVRVGTNEDNTFSIKDNYLFHNGQSRYLGVYNKQDWRSYTSINNNIKDQTFTFFVKKSK